MSALGGVFHEGWTLGSAYECCVWLWRWNVGIRCVCMCGADVWCKMALRPESSCPTSRSFDLECSSTSVMRSLSSCSWFLCSCCSSHTFWVSCIFPKKDCCSGSHLYSFFIAVSYSWCRSYKGIAGSYYISENIALVCILWVNQVRVCNYK